MSGATRRSAGLLAILVCGLAVLGAWTPDAIGDTAVLPFSDDFSVSNGSPLSGFWTEQRGAIAVIDGHATGTGRGNSNVATLNGIDEANVAVQASVASLAPGQRVGLGTRYGGPLEENFYLGQLRGSGAGLHATIWKTIGG